ncbi:MAG: TIGR03943 family protein [Syntrophomonadaceae bacterium]|jgi:putative membrane protein|nr:TIGR03943 family protein [Syntrophomonadaceae bacterium]
MKAQARAFNPQVFWEFLCYSVFAVLIFYLVNSGKYLSYVTPRMEPYLYFTAILMGIWALAGLSRLFRPQYKMRFAHCFVLVVPILLLSLPHAPVSTANFSGQGYFGASSQQNLFGSSGLGSDLNGPQTKSLTENSDETAGIFSAAGENGLPPGGTEPIGAGGVFSDDQTGISEGAYDSYLPGFDVTRKKITVSNNDFGIWASEIYMNMEKYEGYTIDMTGFVLRDPEIFMEDEFVAARLMMSCCVADLSPTGLLCKYDQSSGLKAESWVNVEGTLFIGQYEYEGYQYEEPQVLVTKITPAEEVKGYVYPY